MKLISFFTTTVLIYDASQQIISILSIGFVTMTILWVLSFLKSRKLKAKIKQLEDKK